MKAELSVGLADVRARTLALLEPLDDGVLSRQHSPLMSPLVWDLGHVANYEDQWLVRAITGGFPDRPELDALYDAFQHPRRARAALPIPGPAEARRYGAEVRKRVLALLSTVELDDARLTRDGFVHRMVIQHEHQHDETILAALQLLPPPGYHPVRSGVAASSGMAASSSPLHAAVAIPGGIYVVGTSSSIDALDNERPSRHVDVAPFRLDRFPVTNARYAEFIADGGYDSPAMWTDEGWKWRLEASRRRPQTWSVGLDSRDRFGWLEALAPHEPVQHVCWYEADAFARWDGGRLPTETEWEVAAGNGRGDRYPWGGSFDPAAVDLWTSSSSFGPASVGAHPGGADVWGVEDLLGGVWEWTSSDFTSHRGFEAWPYREYSEVFFGPEYKVLRGGSWATHPSAIRSTFRNWDFPIRRQIFAGLRVARES